MSLSSDVTKLKSKVAKLEEGLVRLDGELPVIRESIDRQESRATSLELGLTSLKSGMEALQELAADLGRQIEKLRNDVFGEGPETPADVFDLEPLGETDG